MRIVLLTFLFTALVTTGAQARLGETPDQLVGRYGQPLNEADQKGEGAKIPLANVTFQKGGFEVAVTITNNLSVQEVFKKINGQPLTADEARVLLAANAQGQQWGAPAKRDGGLLWTRDDNATAALSKDGIMTVRSRQLVVEEAHAKRLEQKPSLEGF